MKQVITFLLSVPLLSYSQTTIPNQDFENWSNSVVYQNIDSWISTKSTYLNFGIDMANVSVVGNAQHGSNAVRIESIMKDIGFGPMIFPGSLLSLNVSLFGNIGFPYSDTVDVFSGYYRNNNVVATDSASVIIELSKNGSVYSSTDYKLFGNHNTWTPFSIPLAQGGSQAPDSVFIAFINSYDQVSGSSVGSWLEIDHIGFEFSNGINPPSDIPNFSFENETIGEIETLDNWWTYDPYLYNLYGAQYISKSTDAFSGDYSLQIETTQEIIDEFIIPVATNANFSFIEDDFFGGSPFTANSSHISFMYKYDGNTNDSAEVKIEAFDNGNEIGYLYDRLGNSSTWINYQKDLNFMNPDSIRILFISGQNLGAKLTIDDLKITEGSNLSILEKTYDLTQLVYPNPANKQFTIQHPIESQIEILTPSNQIIYQRKANNEYSEIESDNWSSGVYLIKVTHEGKIQTQKLILQR